MQPGRHAVRRALAVACALLVVLGASGVVAASSPRAEAPPAPGTRSQVTALVRDAGRATALPAVSYPTLAVEGQDSASRAFPTTSHGCFTVTECVFGDVHAKRTIVLFGDSHAQMWLAAVSPAAVALRYRVVLLFLGGCPFADVTVYNLVPLPPFPEGPYTACNAFRRAAIRDVERLHPALVLLSNRTSMVPSGPSTFFTKAQWEKGDRTTMGELRRHAGRVAVIGDIVYMNKVLPDCLAAEATSVQTCATPNPNPFAHGHELAERSVARSLGIKFINTLPWVCTATCSPVIGPFLVYLNDAHLDDTYVTYLSKVMLASLRWVLK